VTLHVEPDNPAARLYRRLGFERDSDNGVYIKMRRPARVAQPVHSFERAA
jgi:ribosomal protein S18 acetylase RimI-like enzyme